MPYPHVIPADLVTAVRNGNCTVFVGAGFSAASGAPCWDDLARRTAEAICPKDAEGLCAVLEPTEILQTCLNHLNGDKQLLVDSLRPLLNDESLVVREHQRILARLHLSTVFTTNYDTLLERAFAKENIKYYVAVKGWEYKECPTDHVCLGKLHGTLQYPNGVAGSVGDMIVTEDDYERCIDGNPVGLVLLTASLVRQTCLFLGYGFRDRTFRRVHWYVRSRLGDHLCSMYATMLPCLEPIEDGWKRRGVTIIPINPEDAEGGPESLLSFLKGLERDAGTAVLLPIDRSRCDQEWRDVLSSIRGSYLECNRGLERARGLLGSVPQVPRQVLISLLLEMRRLGVPQRRSIRARMVAVARAALAHPCCFQADTQGFATLITRLER